MSLREDHLVILTGTSEALRRVQRQCAQRGVVCSTPVELLASIRRMVIEQSPQSTTLIAGFGGTPSEAWAADLAKFAASAQTLPGNVRCVGLLDSSRQLRDVAPYGLDWYLHEKMNPERIIETFMTASQLEAWTADSQLPTACAGRFGRDVWRVMDIVEREPSRPQAPEPVENWTRRWIRE